MNKTIRQLATEIVTTAGAFYCIAIILLSFLWSTNIYHTWWIEITNIFALLLFLPLLFFIPSLLLIRSQIHVMTVLLSSGIFLLLFGPRFIPPPTTHHRGNYLRILTFNAHHTKTDEVEHIIPFIQTQNADLVATQETSQRLAETMEEYFLHEYPYHIIDKIQDLAFFSRYPIQTTAQKTHLSRMQEITVTIQETHISILNVYPKSPGLEMRHLDLFPSINIVENYNATQRSQDIHALLQKIDSIEGPLIVLGDFNMSDREPLYVDFSRRLSDAYRETNWGFGFTFPSGKYIGPIPLLFPLVRIDYVWSRDGIIPIHTEVLCNGKWSDHCMVIANLSIP